MDEEQIEKKNKTEYDVWSDKRFVEQFEKEAYFRIQKYDREYFNKNYSGLSEDFYLIDKNGKNTNSRPSQNIGSKTGDLKYSEFFKIEKDKFLSKYSESIESELKSFIREDTKKDKQDDEINIDNIDRFIEESAIKLILTTDPEGKHEIDERLFAKYKELKKNRKKDSLDKDESLVLEKIEKYYFGENIKKAKEKVEKNLKKATDPVDIKNLEKAKKKLIWDGEKVLSGYYDYDTKKSYKENEQKVYPIEDSKNIKVKGINTQDYKEDKKSLDSLKEESQNTNIKERIVTLREEIAAISKRMENPDLTIKEKEELLKSVTNKINAIQILEKKEDLEKFNKNTKANKKSELAFDPTKDDVGSAVNMVKVVAEDIVDTDKDNAEVVDLELREHRVNDVGVEEEMEKSKKKSPTKEKVSEEQKPSSIKDEVKSSVEKKEEKEELEKGQKEKQEENIGFKSGDIVELYPGISKSETVEPTEENIFQNIKKKIQRYNKEIIEIKKGIDIGNINDEEKKQLYRSLNKNKEQIELLENRAEEIEKKVLLYSNKQENRKNQLPEEKKKIFNKFREKYFKNQNIKRLLLTVLIVFGSVMLDKSSTDFNHEKEKIETEKEVPIKKRGVEENIIELDSKKAKLFNLSGDDDIKFPEKIDYSHLEKEIQYIQEEGLLAKKGNYFRDHDGLIMPYNYYFFNTEGHASPIWDQQLIDLLKDNGLSAEDFRNVGFKYTGKKLIFEYKGINYSNRDLYRLLNIKALKEEVAGLGSNVESSSVENEKTGDSINISKIEEVNFANNKELPEDFLSLDDMELYKAVSNAFGGFNMGLISDDATLKTTLGIKVKDLLENVPADINMATNRWDMYGEEIKKMLDISKENGNDFLEGEMTKKIFISMSRISEQVSELISSGDVLEENMTVWEFIRTRE